MTCFGLSALGNPPVIAVLSVSGLSVRNGQPERRAAAVTARAAGPVLIRLLRPWLRPYSGQLAVVVALFAMQGAGNLYLPRLNAELIDNGIAVGNTSHIVAIGGVMLGVTVGQLVLAVVALYWATRTSAGVGKDLRAAVFASVQAFSRLDLNQFGVTSLITRNTNDVQQVQLFLQMALTLMVVAPIICVGGLIMAVTVAAGLAKLLVVAIPVMAAAITALLALTVPLFRSMQAGIDRLSQVLREQIAGARVIRAFSRAAAERQRFDAANSDLTAVALRVNRIFVLAMPALTVVLNLAAVAVLWFGGRLVGQAALPIGNLTAFLSYILQILMSVMVAATTAILIPRAVASAEACEHSGRLGVVEFRHVWFQHPGSARAILRDLGITFRPGETTVLIGGTGSGKSTMLGLIPRLLDATSGQVTVDGIDVRRQAPGRLRAAIGLVPQEAFLFSGTVAGNLRFAKPAATDAELWQALQIAQLSDFVQGLPEQLDAAIDQGAANLAGGQRQRLSIARVLLARPRIYLIDDCFAALDGATDARLRASLRAATAGATVIMATQRIAVAADADQVVVLDDGRVAGLGEHRQLLAGCVTYRELAVAQLGEEAAR